MGHSKHTMREFSVASPPIGNSLGRIKTGKPRDIWKKLNADQLTKLRIEPWSLEQ